MNIPDGYMQNAQGHLVPVEQIAPIDLARDELVRDIVAKARVLQTAMIHFKSCTTNDIAAFVQLSAEAYGAELGGEKGNVTLSSFDGRYRVVRSMSDFMEFDERLQVAKQLVDKCILRWSRDSDSKLRALVLDAFQVDKKGKVNTGRVLRLTKLQIKDDPEWAAAMQAIIDSVGVASTKPYIRIYERVGSSDNWAPVALDIAALQV